MPITSGINANVFRAISGSLFSTAANWSRGVVPTGSDVAMIGDNCVIDISRTIGTLVVRPGITASINTGLTFQINDIIDVKGHLSCSGNPTVLVASAKNNINSLSPGSSTFIYYRVGNQSVPGVTYNNLTVASIGTKILIGNTTLNGNLITGGISGCVFELSSYNLIVNGTTTNSVGTFSKTGFGNITFVGNYDTPNQNGCVVSFTGNPNVECRNGFYLGGNFGTCNPGLGTWSFTTNNQDIRNANTTTTFYNIFIANDITLNIAQLGGGANDSSGYPIIVTNSINGGNSNSKFVNKYVTYIGSSSTIVMSTGILDITSFTNAIGYAFNGNHTLPYTTYHSLSIGGTGTKTISGNTTLNGNLGIGLGTLELSTFNLIVTGATSIFQGTFSKSGAGNILFIGNYVIQDQNGTIVNLTGNPTIEFRNGFNIGNNYHTLNFGSGLISFTTNNQEFRSTSALTYTMNNNILISGAITLTWNLVAQLNPILLNGSIDGNNANSKLLMNTNGIIAYLSATQPMATGILDTSTNLNTWIYGNANQGIKGGTYRNLTLNGGGTKTLQGNVSVQNTYTLTAPATVNLNGFTLTNP
jgi:hypothetical protein